MLRGRVTAHTENLRKIEHETQYVATVLKLCTALTSNSTFFDKISRNTSYYYMANPVLGKSLYSHWFFLGQVSMETVQSVYFCFGAKPANSKLATKTAKKKCEQCHSSHWNYQKKLKRLKFFRNFKDGWRRRTFLSASHRKCVSL